LIFRFLTTKHYQQIKLIAKISSLRYKPAILTVASAIPSVLEVFLFFMVIVLEIISLLAE